MNHALCPSSPGLGHRPQVSCTLLECLTCAARLVGCCSSLQRPWLKAYISSGEQTAFHRHSCSLSRRVCPAAQYWLPFTYDGDCGYPQLPTERPPSSVKSGGKEGGVGAGETFEQSPPIRHSSQLVMDHNCLYFHATLNPRGWYG